MQAQRAPIHRETASCTGRAALRTEYIIRDMPIDIIDVIAGATIKLYGFIAIWSVRLNSM